MSNGWIKVENGCDYPVVEVDVLVCLHDANYAGADDYVTTGKIADYDGDTGKRDWEVYTREDDVMHIYDDGINQVSEYKDLSKVMYWMPIPALPDDFIIGHTEYDCEED